MARVVSSRSHWINPKKEVSKTNPPLIWFNQCKEDFRGLIGQFVMTALTTVLPPTWFQVLLSLSPEYFSPFHHCTCILLVSPLVFSLWGYLPPNLGCIPKQPDSLTHTHSISPLSLSEVNRVITYCDVPFQISLTLNNSPSWKERPTNMQERPRGRSHSHTKRIQPHGDF